MFVQSQMTFKTVHRRDEYGIVIEILKNNAQNMDLCLFV